MKQTRIKMCGMTRAEDVKSACELGADLIGMVFYPPSPRSVTIEHVQSLVSAVTPGVSVVTLFVNADAGYVREVVSEARADLIQFHGDESHDYCQQFGTRYLKAIRVKDEQQLTSACAQHQEADGLLLDAYVKGQPGGTGQAFDWGLIPVSIAPKLFLAGGLAPDNVYEAVSSIKPYAVDVSGGIEVSKGVKSPERMDAFIREVRRADGWVRENSS
ncbi:phosphoribosylanthranilate isomerase [Reinekea blandensis]|uniref:N-(5'-phosphoribosyl)anthranilate isomerase n=1 Tax=Reinekea blandensis MED297 TaxID=314283 RepID=A4BHC9_9GAMM|nr:phosphoribosylanthranilate isomerase [Reinekea blandensis]EAR08477.1 N-(5'-phosphoribosyl) anthranilate isomerase [Reinekea sp. MED297] [Reinekea blandensis MED297]